MKIAKSFKHEDILIHKFGYAPVGKPNLYAHIFFIDGLLIDTGQSRMRKAVLNTIKKLSVRQIYITHHHEDHSGNLIELKTHFNCPAYSSALCKQLMKKPPPISFAQNIFWGKRPGSNILEIKENKIETDHYEFKIIPVPGHAVDMVALYEPNKKWLFSADLYVNSYIGYFMREESVKEQINSIKKLLELEFDVLLCSHNPQLKNGKEQLKKKLIFFEKFYQQVSELYHAGNPANQIMRKLKLTEYWPVRLLSGGALSRLNMVNAVIRDENNK
ncbi:MAG: MBL fold metallo-hydrolase [Bacteroidota bacterium]